MTGRPRAENETRKKTNYSSFPRVTAGFAVIHTLSFIFAAGATATGGIVQRKLGQRLATGVVASILWGLSLLLLGVMIRFKKVEIIPKSKTGEMQRWNKERRDSVHRRASSIAEAKASGQKDLSSIPEDDVGWRPLILGNPTSTHRRINVIELGSLTRWTEIRKRNRLVDAGAHAHLNRHAMGFAREELERRGNELFDIHRGGEWIGHIVRKVSRRSLRSRRSYDSSLRGRGIELRDLGPRSQSRGRHPHQHAPFPGETRTQGENDISHTAPEEAGDGSFIENESLRGTNPGESESEAEHVGPMDQNKAGIEERDFEDVSLEDGKALPMSKSQNKQD